MLAKRHVLGGEAWNWTVYGNRGDESSARRPGTDAGSRAGGVQGSVGNMPAAGAGRLSRISWRRHVVGGASLRLVGHCPTAIARLVVVVSVDAGENMLR